MKVLSKSRFKKGLSCPNKLYFNANKSYKNKEDDNTFLASLAEGGFQVEALARLSYHEGHFVDASWVVCFEETARTCGMCRWFTPCVYQNRRQNNPGEVDGKPNKGVQ